MTPSPNWPPGISDQTPLPFATWRVLDALAFKDPVTVRRELNLSEAQWQELLGGAQRAAARVQRQEQLLTDALLEQVRAALTASVGPMGSLILEDTLDDLTAELADVAGQAPTPRLSELLRAVGQELQESQRAAFARQLRQQELI